MVPAVDRSFRILDLLSRSPTPMGTSEVARRLRLGERKGHGLLPGPGGGGGGGRGGPRAPRPSRLGRAVARPPATSDLRRRWRPVLQRLALNTGETAFLGQARG